MSSPRRSSSRSRSPDRKSIPPSGLRVKLDQGTLTKDEKKQYKNLLAESREFLTNWKNFRDQYPEDLLGFSKRSEEKKYADFFENNKILWGGAVEADLSGRFIDQLINLNRYIATTSSTNKPHDREIQEFFVEFYCTREIADKIVRGIKESELEYNYVFFDNSTEYSESGFTNTKIDNLCKDVVEEIFKEGRIHDDASSKQHRVFAETRLVHMFVEDTDISRDDMYVRLYEIL